MTWSLTLLGSGDLLLIFGPYLLNLVVKFVSTHLERFKL
jgi:hypothetical protein